MEPWLVYRERLDRAEIAGPFDRNVVLLVDEDFADQVQTLLRSICDQDFIGGHIQSLVLPVSLRDVVPQGCIPLGRAVLQCRPIGPGQDLGRRLGDFPNGEETRVRQAPREGNDSRVLRHLQYLTDKGFRDRTHPRRIQ